MIDAVWPWVAQIGQERGGFYTYQTLENMVGCKIVNTTKILPFPDRGNHLCYEPQDDARDQETG